MEKERVYLTDITLHVRGYRQTANFSKVAQKGRMYSPLPVDYAQKDPDTDSATARFSFELPQDLKERVARGEIELMIPEGGLPVYAGRDVYEKIKQMSQSMRRQLIHKSRSWFPKKEGV